MASLDETGSQVTTSYAALETIERVLAEALGRDLDRLPVFSPRNVTALAYEAAAELRGRR
jgi:hypothetical protein